MIELFETAEDFFEVITSLGNFLLDTKIKVSFDFLPDYNLLLKLFSSITNLPIDSVVSSFRDALNLDEFSTLAGEYTLAYFVFGYGLIVILIFKIVKFFTDIVL